MVSTTDTIMIYLLLTALILSATCKAVMDTIQFGSYFDKFGKWWIPEYSWTFKYKNGDPKQGERFFGSTTIFVGFCDGWHMAQHFFLFFLFIAMILYPHTVDTSWSWWIPVHFVVIYAGFTGTFEIVYRLLNRKK